MLGLTIYKICTLFANQRKHCYVYWRSLQRKHNHWIMTLLSSFTSLVSSFTSFNKVPALLNHTSNGWDGREKFEELFRGRLSLMALCISEMIFPIGSLSPERQKCISFLDSECYLKTKTDPIFDRSTACLTKKAALRIFNLALAKRVFFLCAGNETTYRL